ncbi:MAG: glycosyl transferase [Burkholderiales bacterium]|nr:glycosyl transferase [Burkholderiales bacterium]
MNASTGSDVVRIFVGCDPNDCDLEQMMVLEYSLRKHASLPLEICWMRLSTDRESPWFSDPASGAGWRTERWATPFSGFRWAVPAACAFEGRAIYMDTDILALGDIAELWRAALPAPAVVLARPDARSLRFCVSLWDCAAARAHLPALDALQREPDSHARCSRHFESHRELVGMIDPAFNCIDGEHLPIERIRMLHYSDMGTQFSHRHALARLAREERAHWFDGEVLPHPRADLATLFDRTLAEALANGRSLEDYRNPAPFGAFVKKSERGHRGNRTTRPTLGDRARRLFGAGPT